MEFKQILSNLKNNLFEVENMLSNKSKKKSSYKKVDVQEFYDELKKETNKYR